MLEEFISFVEDVLPSVDPMSADKAKAAIVQFEKSGEKIQYLTHTMLSQLSQGDIITNVPFCYFDEDGEQCCFKADAMVLSTSCSIDRKDKLTLVPILPLDAFGTSSKSELKDNKIFDYMYIPEGSLMEKYIDFSIIGSYSRELIISGIENGKIHRIESLNQIGLYFLIIKLTIYFMRKEDPDTLHERNCS